MRCLRCEFDNREGVSFCEECGAGLEQLCPACGAMIPPDRKFCGACGRALAATRRPAPTSASASPPPPPPPAPKVTAPRSATPRRAAEDCQLFASTGIPDEHSLKMKVWNHLKKFGEAGTTPRKFTQDLLDRGWARGDADACVERVRQLLDSMVRLPGFERTEKLPGGRYRAVDLRAGRRN